MVYDFAYKQWTMAYWDANIAKFYKPKFNPLVMRPDFGDVTWIRARYWMNEPSIPAEFS